MEFHITKLKFLMKEQGLDAVLIASTANISYLTDFYGFSEIEREAYMIVTKKKAFLIVSPLHFEEAKKEAMNVTVLQRTSKIPLKKVIEELTIKYNIRSCGFEAEIVSYAEYKYFNPLFIKFKSIDLTDLRIIKSTDEISKIKTACALGDKAFSYILATIQNGMTEKDVSLKLELFIRKAGHQVSFPPVVAFNENAAIPHHLTGEKKLTKNSVVLIDFGAKANGYCSDMTRVFFFGSATSEQKKAYQTTVEAQKKAIEYIEKQLKNNKKPIATKVDGIARKYVTDHSYPPFNHSSHGIGLEVHEAPHISSSSEPLEEGVVFSIEPGIYLPGKFGVRIEDIFAIQNNKLIPLTHSTKELIMLSN